MAAGYISPPPPTSPPAVFTHPGQSDYPPPHPYLREPLLFVTNLAANVSDADLARAFESCVPFRPNISRDGSGHPLSGTIEFKELEKGVFHPRNRDNALNSFDTSRQGPDHPPRPHNRLCHTSYSDLPVSIPTDKPTIRTPATTSSTTAR